MGNISETLKVILISADANKEESILRDLLEEESDLAVRFAWPTLRRLVLTDRDSTAHQGSVLAQDAARAAEARDSITVRERLAAYDAWLDRRNAVPETERHEWKISADDIAARAEAILEIADVKAVVDDLKRWRPSIVKLQVALRLVPTLIASGKQSILVETLRAQELPEPWNLLLSVPLALAGEEVNVEIITNSLRELSRRRISRGSQPVFSSGRDSWQQPYFEVLVTACELAVGLGVEADIVRQALTNLRSELWPVLSPSVPVVIDGLIRIWLLEQHIEGSTIRLESLIAALEAEASGSDAERLTKSVSPVARDRNLRDELKAKCQVLFPLYLKRLEVILAVRSGQRDDSSFTRLISDMTLSDFHLDSSFAWRGLRTRVAVSVMRLMAPPVQCSCTGPDYSLRKGVRDSK